MFFFGSDQAGGQNLGQFINIPFKSWIKMSQKTTTHAKKDYHLFVMTKMVEFMSTYENPSQAITILFDTESQMIIENNTKVIEW